MFWVQSHPDKQTKKMNETSGLTYGHQLYFLLLQEVQRHGHVLQLHLADDGPVVVLAVHLLVAEDLQQGDEPQAVAQVVLQVAHPLVHALEMLVDPAGEGVLLDLFPRGVVTQVSLGDRHLGAFFPPRLFASPSECGAGWTGDRCVSVCERVSFR